MDIVSILLGLGVGGGLAFGIQQFLVGKKIKDQIAEAEKEAERIKKERMLQAKENFLKLKEEHESNVKERERRMQ